MKFLGMGWPELVVILIVILIIFGPKNLPKLGNAIGKTVSNLRSGMKDGKKEKAVEEGEVVSASDDAGIKLVEAETDVEVEAKEVFEDAQEGVGVTESSEALAEGVGAEIGESFANVAEISADADGQTQAPKKVVRRVVKKKAVESPVE